MDSLLTKRNTSILVAILALWKMYLAATLQLHTDEVYYWLWSRYLDAGYFDHAPLVGYFIRLTTLFSQQELWVRLSGVLETIIVSALAWVLSLQLFKNENIAAASVITLNVMPLTLAGSILITPDIPVFLFVSATIVAYWQVVATGRPHWWYVMAALFGLALLSKYTGVLVAPALFLFTLATDERKWLKTIHPYAAFLFGCLFFLPVVYWNSKHHWISFAFQMQHGLGGSAYHPGKVFAFLGGQVFIAGILFFLAGAYAAVVALFRKNKEMLYLSLNFLFVLLFFAYSSLKRTAAANWPCCAYFTFGILVSAYCINGSKAKQRFWLAGVILSLLLSITAGLHARFDIIPLSDKLRNNDVTNLFYGWREIAEELGKDPGIKVAFAEHNQLAAEITYYSGEKITGYVDSRFYGAGQYEYWDLPDSLLGKNGVCIHYLEGYKPPECSNYFTSITKTEKFTVTRNGLPLRTYEITYGTGFKGLKGWGPAFKDVGERRML